MTASWDGRSLTIAVRGGSPLLPKANLQEPLQQVHRLRRRADRPDRIRVAPLTNHGTDLMHGFQKVAVAEPKLADDRDRRGRAEKDRVAATPIDHLGWEIAVV